MASGRAAVWILSILVVASVWRLPSMSHAQLSPNYYDFTCPGVENMVRTAFVTQMNLIKIITAPAALLRLAFHDCAGGGGCDGSIMLESQGPITDEKNSERNLGIDNLDVIDTVKAAIEGQCPGTVSCADIIVMVGREAVAFAGGPRFPVALGRLDSRSASTAEAQSSLLPGDTTVDEVLRTFAVMGIDTEEAVALLGAHTLGVAHCANIENRLYPQPDPTLLGFGNAFFLTQLMTSCPRFVNNPNAFVANDLTNTMFDTRYFSDATNLQRGLLTIDDALAKDPRTGQYMMAFQNAGLWFSVFARAYDKMTRFRVLTGPPGEVRLNCRFVN